MLSEYSLHVWLDCSLDLWITDIVVLRMKAAMAALHQDPAEQDVHDFATALPSAMPKPGDSPGASAESEVPIPAREIPREESVLCGTTLRDILLLDFAATPSNPSSADADGPQTSEHTAPHHEGSVFWDDPVIRDWARRHLVDDAMAIETKHTDPECNLNRSQKRAIAAMLAYPVSLIQGVSRCPESVEFAFR
jgi:hypothetical protein